MKVQTDGAEELKANDGRMKEIGEKLVKEG